MSDAPTGSGLASPFTGPFGAVEPNVLIAGIEGAVACWIMRWALYGCALVPDVGEKWHWYYAVLGIIALLGVVLVGLVVEGLAGLVEYVTTRKLWGKNRGNLWDWYVRATAHPAREKWLAGQRWIWESTGANREFARRRTRILVARNTAFLLLVFTLPLPWSGQRGRVALLCSLAFALFVWVWLSANRAYHRAVSEASDIEKGQSE